MRAAVQTTMRGPEGGSARRSWRQPWLFCAWLLCAMLTACGGGGESAPTSILAASLSGANVMNIVVDAGPASRRSVNVPYASVTVCAPGTNTCQVIDHVLVDTGSTGLRLLASAVDPGLSLPVATAANGSSLGTCGQFVSGVTWGGVRRADVRLGSKQAAGINVQIIGDSAFPAAPGACTSMGAQFDTVDKLGAKGILGVGLNRQDCGSACVNNAAPAMYYACSNGSCTTTVASLPRQLSNPVASFGSDNNGLAMVLPAVPDGYLGAVGGALVFGIGTQQNNALNGAIVYPAPNNSFSTTYRGTVLADSIIDSGSNGLFFDDNSLAGCTQTTRFYCPSTPVSLSAVIGTGASSQNIGFTVRSADNLSVQAYAAPLGGSAVVASGFTWGLPFFYGRTVFVALEGAATPGGNGPYWAF